MNSNASTAPSNGAVTQSKKSNYVSSKDLLQQAISQSTFYEDQNKSPVIGVTKAGVGNVKYPIASYGLKSWLRNVYSNLGADDLPDESFIRRVLCGLHDEATRQGELGALTSIQMKQRVYAERGSNSGDIELFWNTQSATGKAIHITKNGWTPNVVPGNVYFSPGQGAKDIDLPTKLNLDQTLLELPVFWKHLLVPESMRLACLAQLITAFFTSEDQPIGVFYSGGEGGDGKTPTALRTRDLIDPVEGGVSPSADGDSGFVAALSSHYCSIVDDATKKTLNENMQARLRTYQVASGGVQSIRALYETNREVRVEMKGMMIITTNDPTLLIADATKRRSIVYEFEKGGAIGQLSSEEYEAAFKNDLSLLRGILLTLTVEVLKEIKGLKPDKNIHSFSGYSLVVQALEKILAGQLSPAIRQNEIKQQSVEKLSESSLLINDLLAVFQSTGHSYSDTRQSLCVALVRLHESDDKAIELRAKDSDYPNYGNQMSRSLKSRIERPEFIAALKLHGVEITTGRDVSKKQDWVSMVAI